MTRRGSALIIVLLLMALLVALTAEMVIRSSTEARAMENRHTHLQAQYAMQGALAHAIEILKADLAADMTALSEQNLPPADWEGEAWATAVSNLPLGDGTYGFAIADEESRWHLNALVDGAGALVPAEQDAFARLMEACCPGQDTAAFRNALADWMDADTTGDFEEGAPNRLLLTTKELAMVPGATSDLLDPLLPKATRWTSGQVNVNTAPWEVLYAISPRFDQAAFARLQAARPLRSLDDLRGPLDIAPADPIPPELAGKLSCRSTFYRVAMHYAKGGDTRRATAIVLRVTGQPARLWWDPDPRFP